MKNRTLTRVVGMTVVTGAGLLAACAGTPTTLPSQPIAVKTETNAHANGPHGMAGTGNLGYDRVNSAANAEWTSGEVVPQSGTAPWVAAAAAAGRMTPVRPTGYSTPNNAGQRATTAREAGDSATAISDPMDGLTRVSYAEEGSDFDPCVSRDGKWMVFASTQHRPTSDIYLKQVNGRTVTQLTADPANDAMPVISPDGGRVAFCSDRAGSWHLYIMSIHGGQPVQLTEGMTQDLHPSWSPDGKKIVFCRLGQVSGRWEMWVLDVSQPTAEEFVGYGMFPEWSPVAASGENGSDKILFQRSRERGDRAFGLWTIDYTPGSASSPTQVVGEPGMAAINPSWSPDGKWITYSLVNTGGMVGGGGPSDLWITAIDGSGRVQLSAGKATNYMPSWGADGRVYFVSDRGGPENIWSIGTEKAIAAATGKAPTATASAMKHEGEPEHAAHGEHAASEHAAAPAHAPAGEMGKAGEPKETTASGEK